MLAGTPLPLLPGADERAQLSWPMTPAIVAAGGLFCLLIVKLLGA